jgi:hypothetical protein
MRSGIDALCWALAILVIALILIVLISAAAYYHSKRREQRIVDKWRADTVALRSSITEGSLGLLGTNLGTVQCRVLQVDQRNPENPRVLAEYIIDGQTTSSWVGLEAIAALMPDTPLVPRS